VDVELVERRDVKNALVDVVFVKTPVEGVVAPITVPSIDPPLISTLEDVNDPAVREAIVALLV